MSQMDLFTPLLQTTDTRKKLAIGTDIINYLGLPSNSIECDDIGMFIDGLVPWLQSSNFKVRKIYDKDTVLQRRIFFCFVLFCIALGIAKGIGTWDGFVKIDRDGFVKIACAHVFIFF